MANAVIEANEGITFSVEEEVEENGEVSEEKVESAEVEAEAQSEQE
jgi:hypothetical protein